MNAPRTRASTVRRRAALFDEAIRLIALEHPQELTVEDVARRLGTSRRQLQRAFKEAGRTTFRDHLRGVRMAAAAELPGARPPTVAWKYGPPSATTRNTAVFAAVAQRLEAEVHPPR